MEIHSGAEKAAGEEKRTKGARNCTGNTKAREEEEKRGEREDSPQCKSHLHCSSWISQTFLRELQPVERT